MGFGDDIKNTAQDLAGKAKEAFGNVTGNEDAVREGKSDQFEAGVKDKAADVRDSFDEAGDDIKAKIEDLRRDHDEDQFDEARPEDEGFDPLEDVSAERRDDLG